MYFTFTLPKINSNHKSHCFQISIEKECIVTLSFSYGLPTPVGGRASHKPPPAGNHFSWVFRLWLRLGAAVAQLAHSQAVSVNLTRTIRAALHLEAGPIPLEVDCMKFSTFYREVANFNWVRPQTHRLIFINLGTELPWRRELQPG